MQTTQSIAHALDRAHEDLNLVNIIFGDQGISTCIFDEEAIDLKKDIDPIICMEEKKTGEISYQGGGITYEENVRAETGSQASPKVIDPAAEGRIVKRNNIYESFFD